MQPEIQISTDELQIIKGILQQALPQQAKIWIFGSRATGKAKRYSDADLAIDINGKNLDLQTLGILDVLFEESDLPWKVDIVDYNNVSTNFRSIIDNEKQLLLKL